jgi:hypothetical protein
VIMRSAATVSTPQKAHSIHALNVTSVRTGVATEQTALRTADDLMPSFPAASANPLVSALRPRASAGPNARVARANVSGLGDEAA